MEELFSWIPYYEELADNLRLWRDRQSELITCVDKIRISAHALPELMDKGVDDEPFLLREIDPFTVFALFNRGITDLNRISIAAAFAEIFGVKSPLPQDFAGIPVVDNRKTWFFGFARTRQSEDIPLLWNVFDRALGDDPLNDDEFAAAFDKALMVKGVRFNLTMGLFWIRPRTFLSLDGVLQQYAGLKVSGGSLNARRYLQTIDQVREKSADFPRLSYDAWLASREPDMSETDDNHLETSIEALVEPGSAPVFWFVGASWDSEDQTERFVSDGIWENGYDNRYIDQVKSMRPGEKIAIKAAFTRKHNLPFDARGKTVSVMSIKAIGTIAANPGDGKRVEVIWDKTIEPPRDWYFYTNRTTVWGVRRGRRPFNNYLIEFAFNERQQDHAWFLSQPYWIKWLNEEKRSGIVHENTEDEEINLEGTEQELSPYTVATALAEGVFLDPTQLERLTNLLRARRNLILQGPPGVGKTYLAMKLAYLLLGVRDPERVMRVQFHQTMSYEDFVRGFRPRAGANGFELTDGPFLEIAEQARVSPEDREHVLIIEEINRGNPSGIFGELLTLLESDKRKVDDAIRLTHRAEGEEPFFVPPNLYLIGTMNLADRSLAVMDHALRRRFVFADLAPEFGDAFIIWCERRGMNREFVREMRRKIQLVNRLIEDDPNLGKQYLIGHSYFCPSETNLQSNSAQHWYREIVETQVMPLLEEYWFDNKVQVDEARRVLVGSTFENE